jgi:hypothetical protein
MGFKNLGTQFQTDIVSDQVAPPWLQNPVGSAYLQTMGKGLDLIRFRSAQASLLHMPGQGDTSADYYIGLDRLLTQGQSEPYLTFEARLSKAFDTWQHAGNDWSVLEQVLSQLLPLQPAARTISETGRWSYYPEAGNTALPPSEFLAKTSNWNWDNASSFWHPLSPTAWWRFWLVVNAGMTVVGTSINGATFASPIEFSTTTPHGLVTNAQVYIDQVSGNLGANGGPFMVVVDSPTTFYIPGLNGTGIWSGGGYVYRADQQGWAAPFPCLGTPGSPCLGVSTYGIPISGATDASQIEISTSVPHGLFSGYQVYINEVGGNTAANTKGLPWTVTVDAPTAFRIRNSQTNAFIAGNGAYSGGGYVFLAGDPVAIPPTSSLGFLSSGDVTLSTDFWNGLRALLSTYKTAHASLWNIIVTFDQSLFVQDTPLGADQPDGTYAWPAKLVAGVYVPARATNARFVAGIT